MPPVTGTVQSCGIQRMPIARFEVKSTLPPSGLKSRGVSSTEAWVNRRGASLPSTGMTKMSGLPWRVEAKAMCPPSRDQIGWRSSAG